jgi:hypothetical protein
MSARISVALVTLNGERYLEEQLASIASQEPAPFEVVIADDGSTDRTRDVAEAALADASFPVRFVGGDHVGLRRNVERAIRGCTGSVIALSDQDDIWLPGRLDAIGRAFEDPSVTLWFSDADLIDGRGVPTGARLWELSSLTPQAQHEMTEGYGLRRLIHGGTVTGATMAFRESVRTVALPLPVELDGPDFLFLHDGWLAVLAALSGLVATEPHPFTRYRQHEQQFTSVHAGSLSAAHGIGERRATRRTIEREHGRVRLVLERLVERNALAGCSAHDRRMLTELEAFLRHRAAKAGMARTRAILTEVRVGHYRLWANGWRTALADLLYPRA